ncbi:uncharacterized protein LOC131613929 [Vicia villosa]|uniref:uncharacterized protein LOC131613929 n=1 Tax=Vicia villosa TaxID=3911 RepID=UPI00273A8767|nr:uncharacterized protein LOC131613929 [Vicia villosa]
MLEGLWKNRNDFVWHNEKEDASKLGWLAFHKWQEWFLAQNPRETQIDNGELAHWSPPSSGCFKWSAWDSCTFFVLEAEALALKEAIQASSTFHNTPLIFESDSQHVVKALSSSSKGSSEFITIINYIKLLLLNFPNIKVKFIKRQANMVAYTLAKAANSWSRRCLFDVIPPCITFHLINEIS